MADLGIVDAEVKADARDGTEQGGIAGELITPGMPVVYDGDDELWYKAYASGGSMEANVGAISLSRGARGQHFKMQTDGSPKLGVSAGIVVGTTYGVSSTPGKICPFSDLKTTDYRSVLGVGNTGGVLAMRLFSPGILPGPTLNNSLANWAMAARVTDNTPVVSPIINRNGYNEVTFHFNIGTMATAAATFTVLLEGGNVANLSDAAPVADVDMVSQLIGTAPEVAASWNGNDDGEVRKLGYKDDTTPYQYLRLTVTPADNLGNADFAVICVLGAPPATPVFQTAA